MPLAPVVRRAPSFVYAAGVYTPIDVPGADGWDAYGINNPGQVVGQHFTVSDDGDFGAFTFVATPVPEPGTLALLAAGAGGLAALARRRRSA